MELVKIGKKGQVTIPRSLLKAAGIPEEARLVVEATSDGAIVMRQAVVYPIEMYTDERIAEFAAASVIPAAMEKRVQAYLKKARKKR
jgi:bifunctional DNA-binding transcriptional regulator/antitoxin component of YhaV-PrlF toxin-antitoxin module